MNKLNSLIIAGSSLLILSTNCGAFAQDQGSASSNSQIAKQADNHQLSQLREATKSEAEWLEEIYNFLYAGEFDAALALCSTLIAEHPDSAEGYALRGQINLYDMQSDNPNLDQIESDFNKALAINPNHIDALWGRVDVSRERKNWTAAEADLLTIRRLNPTGEDVICELINVHRNMNRLDKVMQDFEYWIGFAPDEPFVYESRARFHVKMGNHNLAIADLEKAYRLYVAQGDEDEASRVKEQIASAKQSSGSAG